MSVIINCFNGEAFVSAAISSVINQSYENIEIIFWDNCSTDKSADIVKSYKDTRIKYYLNESHTKLYEARKFAVEKSSGDFLAFIDVDDIWDKSKIEKQIPLFENKKVGIACSNYWIGRSPSQNSIFRRKLAIQDLEEGYVFNKLLKNYFVGLLTLVIRREAYCSLDYGFDPRFNLIGDFDLVIRLAKRWELRCIDEPLAFYRVHPNSLSSRFPFDEVNEKEAWLSEMTDSNILDRNAADSARAAIAYSKVLAYLLSGERRKASLELRFIPFGTRKLKAIILLVFPTVLLKRLV